MTGERDPGEEQGTLRRRISGLVRPPRDLSSRFARLQEALASSGPIIIGITERNRESPWSRAARELLDNARAITEVRQANRGWGCLLEAERQVVGGMTSQELEARARAVRRQADAKLRDWRRTSVAELLGNWKDALPDEFRRGRLIEAVRLLSAPSQDGSTKIFEAERKAISEMTSHELEARAHAVKCQAEADSCGWRRAAVGRLLEDWTAPQPPEEVRRVHLLESMRILNDHFHNEYTRIDLRASNLGAACGVISALVLLVLVAATVRLVHIPAWLSFGVHLPFSEATAWHLILVIVFGTLGGAVSSAFPLSLGGGGAIPEHFSARMSVFARPFLGAAGALAVYALLKAGVMAIPVQTPWQVVAWAFTAGFSERLLLRLIDTAVPGTAGNGGAAAGPRAPQDGRAPSSDPAAAAALTAQSPPR